MAHIVIHNPIILDSMRIKKEYLRRLNRYIKVGGWDRRKYENSELCAYEKIVLKAEDVQQVHTIDFYHYFIFLMLCMY